MVMAVGEMLVRKGSTHTSSSTHARLRRSSYPPEQRKYLASGAPAARGAVGNAPGRLPNQSLFGQRIRPTVPDSWVALTSLCRGMRARVDHRLTRQKIQPAPPAEQVPEARAASGRPEVCAVPSGRLHILAKALSVGC